MLGYKHGRQSAIFEIIGVKLISYVYFDQYLPCTKYEDDPTKTKAIIASQHLENKHGHQSAILNVIHVVITDCLHFDLYLSCTTYKADRIKTEAVTARQRKCYAQQKLSKIRVDI